MSPEDDVSDRQDPDPLAAYADRVTGLNDKLSRIIAGQQEVAESLGRAAAALRSIAAARKSD